MNNEEIKIQLNELADQEYQKFSSSLIPGCRRMIGVRIPKLRLLAKQIAKEDFRSYIRNACDDTFEEVMLQGFVIGYAKADIDEILKYAAGYIPKINDWSLNDGFCSTFKIAAKNREKVWDFLMKYKDSEYEFEQRVVAIMLMDYFMTDEYIHKVLVVLKQLKHDGYYLKMGVAWAIATAGSKYPDLIINYLQSNPSLDLFTYNKAIQKMIESYRITPEMKAELRKLKRKK